MKAFLKAPTKCVTHCAPHREKKLFIVPTLIQFNYKVNKNGGLELNKIFVAIKEVYTNRSFSKPTCLMTRFLPLSLPLMSLRKGNNL